MRFARPMSGYVKSVVSSRFFTVELGVDMMKKVILLLALLVGLGGCTYVKVSPEAEGVRVAAAVDAVKACKKLGSTTVSVVAKVLLERGKNKVASELSALARNQAAKLGGDTVVPVSDVYDGQRKFDIYQCAKS